MRLVDWNAGKTSGKGRSGTRYLVTRGTLEPADSSLAWIIAVDGEPVCATDTARNAVRRVEHLEALRCFLTGLGREITIQQLLQARAIAVEMGDAVEESIHDPALTPAQIDHLRRSAAELRSLDVLIGQELEERTRTLVPERMPAYH